MNKNYKISRKSQTSLREKSTHQSFARFYQRTIHAIHFVVESTCIAEVMSRAIASPQGRTNRTAVHTFATFAELKVHSIFCSSQEEKCKRRRREKNTQLKPPIWSNKSKYTAEKMKKKISYQFRIAFAENRMDHTLAYTSCSVHKMGNALNLFFIMTQKKKELKVYR